MIMMRISMNSSKLIKIIKSSKDRKILVFSQFTQVLGLIAKRFEKENIEFNYLDGKIDAKRD